VIFGFTGKARTVDISKGHTRFCRAAFIDAKQHRLFNELRNEYFPRGLGKPAPARRLAHCAGGLNAVHPFRDGNGRAIRIFLRQLAAIAGHDLAYREADEESLMRTDTAASDSDYEQLAATNHRSLGVA
jgi:cell filamentation protein